MASSSLLWWFLLCTLAVLNPGLWIWSARRLGRGEGTLPADIYATRKALLWLSAIYVLGCGFRSLFPMVDVPRMCLHDTGVSRIVVGRTVATVAELCFAVQWALLISEGAAATGSTFGRTAALTLVALIAVAEVFSWGAVLTANNLLHAIENSLWTASAVLAVSAFAAMRGALETKPRRVISAFMLGGAAYVLFMVTMDVPMYLSRWRLDQGAGHVFLTVTEGWREILQRCMVVRDWSAWRQDAAWLTLYFSVAVWASISLAHVPPLRSAQPRRT